MSKYQANIMKRNVTANKNSDDFKDSVMEKLNLELRRLQEIVGLGLDLKVVWLPGGSSRLSGEVKNGKIIIYEENLENALDVLRHEFIDYTVSLAIKPYERVAYLYKVMLNALIGALGEEAYQQKEKVIESLKRLLSAQL